MKKLSAAVDRFCALHPRFGIPNLMKYIVGGNLLVYLLYALSDYQAIQFLTFDLAHLLKGEIWRLFTFIFVPDDFGILFLLLSLYFYYFIGNILEREWGTAKFTLYYVSGVVLTLLGTILTSLLTGFSMPISGTAYINLSMFFAFAVLYPDMQVLLFFIIPLKMKWLAWLDGGLFAISIIRSLLHGDFVGMILPILALLNFAVFFAPNFFHFAEKEKYRHSRSATQFRNAAAQNKQAESAHYHHKCCVCGRTDVDSPQLQFRYCSRCAGYHCFCQDHIFNHVHFEE
ncbi:MAG: rhomboid family intramembrane serine protease [Oscillospiraceae bacterium]